jgi:heme-degrading monooxygenase HmoA
MDDVDQYFSVGIWLVKPGKEYDFISAFNEFAKWVFNQDLGAGEVFLLQDLQEPRRIITCGPWDSLKKIDEWRKLPEFKEFFINAKKMCDEVTPLTMKPIIYLKRPAAE